MLSAKEAAKIAKDYLKEMAEGRIVGGPILEEIEFREGEDEEEDVWLVTLSFELGARKVMEVSVKRYKIFEISAEDGEVISMKIRTF